MLLATSVFNSMVDEDLFPDFSAVIHGNQAACQTSITCANSTGTQTAVSKVINLGLAAGHKRIVHEQREAAAKSAQTSVRVDIARAVNPAQKS